MTMPYANASQAAGLYAKAATTRGPVAGYVSMFDYLIKQSLLAGDAYADHRFEDAYEITQDVFNVLVKMRGLVDASRCEDSASLHSLYTELIRQFLAAPSADDHVAHYKELRDVLVTQRNQWARAAGLGEIPVSTEVDQQPELA